jgi:RNA polymerase-binding protein DksA
MSKKLTTQDLKKFKDLLLRLKSELTGDISNLEKDALSTDGERVSVDSPADVGSESFAQEFSLELLARDEETLGNVMDALERIDSGDYGICESCGQAIRKTRLEAVPYARNCIDCQRELERAG